ncbi:unnamed protein product [Diamesa hyperborea]
MLIFVTLLAIHAGFVGSILVAPENITITFINPTSVRVSWQTAMDTTFPIEKFDVTYKPIDASYRVVAEVAAINEAVVLGGLIPDTQYQVTVAAIWDGRKHLSRPIVFRTLGEIEESPRTSPQQDLSLMIGNGPPIPPLTNVLIKNINNPLSNNTTSRELPTIRGVEVGIVLVVLMVWAGAIALFFNRWGKIRMLLPYQPDYKQDQLKVPGTGACAPGACNGPHTHSQHLQHWSTEEPSNVIAERCQRARINSAIFVSSEGRGFDSIEFIRRYGSQSVLCRKAKSAENIPSGDRNRRFSENKEWDSEERTSPQRDNIELVECHNEPTTSIKLSSSTKKTPKLNTLPTLSISVPSPSPPHEEEEDFL